MGLGRHADDGNASMGNVGSLAGLLHRTIPRRTSIHRHFIGKSGCHDHWWPGATIRNCGIATVWDLANLRPGIRLRSASARRCFRFESPGGVGFNVAFIQDRSRLDA